ncbi:MAG: hypothetical protein FVQ82_06905 [Planctomycetes bacterium]|nr:hypothetical protein [Planctomycetota bacterium]
MKSKFVWFLMAVLFVVIISGCHRVAQDTTTFNQYYRTALKVSTSADVISMIGAEGEARILGENAVASCGEAKKGSVIWFNAVAFDDDTSRAFRKYAFVANPKAKGFGMAKTQTMRFDAKLVINIDVLNEPHANDNARKIAVLKSLLKDFSGDLKPLEKDSSVLKSGSLMVKQLLKGLIYKLEASPARAGDLEKFTGMDFDHMTLDKGKARMVIDNGVVELKVMTGSTIKNFNKKLDVLSM